VFENFFIWNKSKLILYSEFSKNPWLLYQHERTLQRVWMFSHWRHRGLQSSGMRNYTACIFSRSSYDKTWKGVPIRQQHLNVQQNNTGHPGALPPTHEAHNQLTNTHRDKWQWTSLISLSDWHSCLNEKDVIPGAENSSQKYSQVPQLFASNSTYSVLRILNFSTVTYVCHFSPISPTRCTILFNIFISLLYMFWASMCASLGENYCIYATLVFVTLYRWHLVCQTRCHPYRVTNMPKTCREVK
jgi:hypothetical protein